MTLNSANYLLIIVSVSFSHVCVFMSVCCYVCEVLIPLCSPAP